ncbi:MAG: hypothetical protein ACFFG0_04925 [Candidatus Thorarchaeota archaeon]
MGLYNSIAEWLENFKKMDFMTMAIMLRDTLAFIAGNDLGLYQRLLKRLIGTHPNNFIFLATYLEDMEELMRLKKEIEKEKEANNH